MYRSSRECENEEPCSARKMEFVPTATEALGKQLHLFGGVCSHLCGFVLATGDATSTAAGTDVQWQMSLEGAI